MRFELFIASRYLRAKRKQAVIGVITGISIVGVAAGGGLADHCAGDQQWIPAGFAGPASGLDFARKFATHHGRRHPRLARGDGLAAKTAPRDRRRT